MRVLRFSGAWKHVTALNSKTAVRLCFVCVNRCFPPQCAQTSQKLGISYRVRLSLLPGTCNK